MKKPFIIAIVVAILLIGYGVSIYNGMVSNEEIVEKAWNDVETQYQRRADLIPNLVNTVKGYAAHEKSTLEEIVAARAKATQLNVDATNLTPENIQAFQNTQGSITSALSKLIAIAENYPDLKANENFKELQAQLEGTENRISESRRLFNEAIQKYNISVRKFPNNIFASLFGFEKKSGFQAEAGTEKATKVEF